MALPEREYQPTITLPPHVPATPEELARRKALALRVDRLREKMPPLGMSTSELIRQVRDEAENIEPEQETDDRAS